MPPETHRSSRLESTAFYSLLAAVVLAPLAFWPSQYFALESMKTAVISILSLVAVLVTALLAWKEKSLRLPPKSLAIIGAVSSLSILLSSIASGHFVKSFFGQGFELGTGMFLITLIGASYAAYSIISRRADRGIVLYAGLFGAFILVWVIQILRLFAGPQFLSLGILNAVTSTLIGSWFSFGIFSAIIALISFAAIMFLKLSSRMRTAYWVLFAVSAIALFIVNSHQVWEVLALVFLGLTIYLTSQKQRPAGPAVPAFFRRLVWLPLVACVISAILAWQGISIAGPVISKLNAGYTEIAMPWQMTMDITAGTLKAAPLFGTGPNRFTQAFLAFKPAAINTTDAWGVEFSAGFGLIPTFFATEGFAGLVVWILFFVFFGILGVRSLRSLARTDSSNLTAPEQERPYARFLIISSYAAAAFVWLIEFIYVPSHAIIFLGFVLTGIWLGASVAYGRLSGMTFVPRAGNKSAWAVPALEIAGAIVALFFLATFIKNTAALGYFSSGVQELTAAGEPLAADQAFARAVSLNPLDIYWQARAEAGISIANKMLSTITATSTASTSASVIASAGQVVNSAIGYTNNAIAEDPTNYNNYVSQARVAELASAMRMQNGYESAVTAYTNAIKLNPGNPSLYLSLAQLQASQKKYDDAIQTLGAALQVKQNYLDAVYLLSQIEAANGNLDDAIPAAQFAIQLNPNEPILYFQLGVLEYNKPDYAAAQAAFAQAVKLNPNYANALYFLGLSDARLGKTPDAITAFETLSKSNPDNQEIAGILSALRAGKPLFAGSQQKATKPQTLPIKEK